MKRAAILAVLVSLGAAALVALPACRTEMRQAPPAPSKPTQVVIRDIPLLKLPEGDRAYSVQVGPYARHAAMKIRHGDCDWIEGKGHWMALIDGRLSATYDVPKPPPGRNFEPTVFFEFSPDGNHVAYVGCRDDKQFIVFDGVKGPEYERVVNPQFSPDSRRFAYDALKDGKWVCVIDGIEKRLDEEVAVGSLSFSPDSQGTAYIGCCVDAVANEVTEFLVVNEVEVGWHESPICDLALSPDWRRWAYWVWDTPRQGHVAYIDGKAYPLVEEGSQFLFSPDSMRVAYGAVRGGKKFVVVDGVAGKRYDEVTFPRFSPDSRHGAYWGWRGKEMVFVMNGVESEPYRVTGDGPAWRGRWEIEFSPNSKRVACVGISGDKWFVAVDGVKGKLYDDVSGPVFSPDSRWFYYVAVREEKVVSVIDGIECGQVDFSGEDGWLGLWEYRLALSPDSRHVAVALKVGGKYFLIADGRRVEGYEDFGGFSFTPDSAHLVCWAKKEGKWYITVDGVSKGEAYDELARWFPWIDFDDARSGVAVAARNGELLRVELEIKD